MKRSNLLSGAATLLALSVIPELAIADCVKTGSDVLCSAVDADGFSDLTPALSVVVEDTADIFPATGSALVLGADAVITVDGDIASTEANVDAVTLESGGVTVSATGAISAGADQVSSAAAAIYATGNLTLDNAGYLAGDFNTVEVEGVLTAQNSGTISSYRNVGGTLVGGAGSSVVNTGSLLGGVFLGKNSAIDNAAGGEIITSYGYGDYAVYLSGNGASNVAMADGGTLASGTLRNDGLIRSGYPALPGAVVGIGGGTLENLADGTILSLGTSTLLVALSGGATVVNDGFIGDDTAYGIAQVIGVEDGDTAGQTIINSGTLHGGSRNGTLIDLGDGADQITFLTGSVVTATRGDVKLGAGDDGMTFDGAFGAFDVSGRYDGGADDDTMSFGADFSTADLLSSMTLASGDIGLLMNGANGIFTLEVVDWENFSLDGVTYDAAGILALGDAGGCNLTGAATALCGLEDTDGFADATSGMELTVAAFASVSNAAGDGISLGDAAVVDVISTATISGGTGFAGLVVGDGSLIETAGEIDGVAGGDGVTLHVVDTDAAALEATSSVSDAVLGDNAVVVIDRGARLYGLTVGSADAGATTPPALAGGTSYAGGTIDNDGRIYGNAGDAAAVSMGAGTLINRYRIDDWNADAAIAGVGATAQTIENGSVIAGEGAAFIALGEGDDVFYAASGSAFDRDAASVLDFGAGNDSFYFDGGNSYGFEATGIYDGGDGVDTFYIGQTGVGFELEGVASTLYAGDVLAVKQVSTGVYLVGIDTGGLGEATVLQLENFETAQLEGTSYTMATLDAAFADGGCFRNGNEVNCVIEAPGGFISTDDDLDVTVAGLSSVGSSSATFGIRTGANAEIYSFGDVEGLAAAISTGTNAYLGLEGAVTGDISIGGYGTINARDVDGSIVSSGGLSASLYGTVTGDVDIGGSGDLYLYGSVEGTISATSGTLQIQGGGFAHALVSGSGDDIISIETDGAVSTAGGDDVIFLSMATGASVQSGAGNDEVYISGGGFGLGISLAGNDDTLWMALADLDAATSGGGFADGGSGSDLLRLYNADLSLLSVSAYDSGTDTYSFLYDEGIYAFDLTRFEFIQQDDGELWELAGGVFAYLSGPTSGEEEVIPENKVGVSAVPAPAGAALLPAGLLALFGLRRARRAAA